MNPPSSLIHHTQQQFDDPPNVVGKTSTAASDKILRRPLGNNGNGNESALISMRRKHRSLDGSQFLSRFDGSSVAYEASTAGLGESGGEFSQQQQQQHEYGGNPGPSSSVPYSNMPTRVLYGRTGGYGSSWPQNRGGERPPSSYDFLPPSSYDHHRYGGGEFFPPWEAYDFGENGFRDPSLLPPHQNPYLTSFGSYVPQFSSPAEDPVILWREYSKLRDKYNKLLQSVQETQRWSPADMNPEFQRQQEALRLCEIKLNDANITAIKRRRQMSSLDMMHARQAAELQMVRNDMESREREICQLLEDTDLAEMEAELRRLRQQVSDQRKIPPPREFTDKGLNMHEFQTVKAQLERSELTLAEKTRELQNCELTIKGLEEQKAEAERRYEILSNSTGDHERHLRLLHEDLDALRAKLELKNQQLDIKEKSIKGLEQELQTTRTKSTDEEQKGKDAEHRVSQLVHRMDQMEAVIRERDALIGQLKRRLMQEPGTRMENELQQRLEQAMDERRRLEELVDSVRKNAESERQQQLKAFHDEIAQLKATIFCLQKELADRHVLISSQNEKISQLDETRAFSVGRYPTKKKIDPGTAADVQKAELEEAQSEIDRLLRIVRNLEREKLQLLCADRGVDGRKVIEDVLAKGSSTSSELVEGEQKKRIVELEEALRESVGITTEKESQIIAQKQQIMQLQQNSSAQQQMPNPVDQIALSELRAKLADAQKLLETERAKHQRQMASIRKEYNMALIAEKDACIALIQNPVETTWEKLQKLVRQREQLKHGLLVQDSETSFIGHQIPTGSHHHAIPHGMFTGTGTVRPTAATMQSVRDPIRVQTFGQHYTAGRPMAAGLLSAPASIRYYNMGDEDDGIWA